MKLGIENPFKKYDKRFEKGKWYATIEIVELGPPRKEEREIYGPFEHEFEEWKKWAEAAGMSTNNLDPESDGMLWSRQLAPSRFLKIDFQKGDWLREKTKKAPAGAVKNPSLFKLPV